MKVSFLKSAFQEAHFPPPDRPEVAFAGKSNVGKSSLINTLTNRKKLARTSSTPGRTQAINFFDLDGRIYFVDLPGYGFAKVPLEVRRSWGKMVEGYLKGRANLKAVVIILDIRREVSQGDLSLLEWLNHYNIRPIIILTKADKLSRNQAFSRAKSMGGDLENYGIDRPIIFSAKTRQGREEIWERIEEIITVNGETDPYQNHY
jgi:GTP-binding protein